MCIRDRYKSTDLDIFCPNIFSTLSLSLAERYLLDLLFSGLEAHEITKIINMEKNNFIILTVTL